MEFPLVVMSVNPVTFVAPNLAWGEARGGSIPSSGAVTDEQRSPRPNSAQPFGRRFFSAPAALLAPYRSTGGICSSLAPCRDRKLLAANVTGFTLLATELDGLAAGRNGKAGGKIPGFVAPEAGKLTNSPGFRRSSGICSRLHCGQ